MYRKLLVAIAVSALATGVASAHNYKGDYKGEAPCPVYVFAAGPYVGLSTGPRNNYTGTPTVYKGWEGQLSAGWGMMMNPMFYFAGEVFAGSSVTIRNFRDQLTGTNSVKTTWNYGISFIPGIMVTDHVLGYARVGATRARFSTQGVNETGWHVGIGGQTNVWQNWDVRGEYVYTQFGRVDNNIGKAASDLFMLGVVYKFI